MTTYNTGNPLGSADPKDLYDNAQNLDNAVNSTDLTFNDRLGVQRATYAGLEDKVEGLTNSALAYRNQAESSASAAAISEANAQAAAEGSGDVLFYNTYALANAALAGLPEGQVVEVFVDETKGSQRTRYRKESGVYVPKLIFETVFVDSRTDLKGLDTAFVTSAYLTEAGRAGYFKWDATIDNDRARADADELDFVSPNLAVDGAWVRSTITDNDKIAINRALNEKPYEFRANPVDIFNPLPTANPYHGRQININSTSENLADAHYAKENGISIVSGDTIKWNGVTLERITGINGFTTRLRDIRAADFPLVPGKRYIASAIVCAPFTQLDNYGINAPWNRFMWMWQPTNGTSFGAGAKLIGPVPRRVWTVVQADTTTTYRVVRDPSISLELSPSSTDGLMWYAHAYGLGGSLAGDDIYIGGFQLEEAPNQTEKVGIALIGTSIDTSTSSLQHWTQDRSWPRYLEGLLSVPIFNGAIGGQTSTTLEARFDTDIAVWGVNAKYCILAANVNDFSSGFNSALYRSNWLSMYNKAIAAGMIPIFITPPRRSSYNYANGPADMEAEIQYIKDTYPFVIDRDLVWQDPFNPNLLNQVYEDDGIHAYDGIRELAFMIYSKYRQFFSFDNVPGAYQKTQFDNAKIQSFGSPVWAGRYWASRVTSSSNVAVRDNQAGTAPVMIFEAALAGATTYQLPCPNYHRPAERVNTDVQIQQVRNATTGGFNISIQYYARDVSDVLSTVGPGLGPIPPGETWTLACDGTTAWRVQ